MGRKGTWLIVAVVVVALVAVVAVWLAMRQPAQGGDGSDRPGAAAEKPKRVREPAVAGLFYPIDKTLLSRAVKRHLARAKPRSIADLRGLVCPHAGYEFSGPTAAHAYRLLPGRDLETVIILGCSHYANYQGASIPDADAYATPFGTVDLSDKAKALAKVRPFVVGPRCRVGRPGWWRRAPKAIPPFGQDTPHTWEHSLEVQLPFLQSVLKDFKIVPILYGEVDPEEAANALEGFLDEKTLVVVSTDLSHYKPYDTAKKLDTRCVEAICSLDIEKMKDQEACAKSAVLTLMHLAKKKGWKAKLLDYRNSGDTSGDKRGVVGYAAIAFYDAGQELFTTSDRKLLLELARKTLKEVVSKGGLPEFDASGLPAKFTEKKGCFVTLTKDGKLRGCIGHILPQTSLHKAVMENARSAATRDKRFDRVRTDELDDIEIEISVLTVPQRLSFNSPEDLLAKLRPHKDGVVLQIGSRTSTYLPQVWEQIPDKEAFLSELSRKAGCAPAEWRGPGTTVFTYQVESFKESEM